MTPIDYKNIQIGDFVLIYKRVTGVLKIVAVYEALETSRRISLILRPYKDIITQSYGQNIRLNDAVCGLSMLTFLNSSRLADPAIEFFILTTDELYGILSELI